jgi:hypothetical protein
MKIPGSPELVCQFIKIRLTERKIEEWLDFNRGGGES